MAYICLFFSINSRRGPCTTLSTTYNPSWLHAGELGVSQSVISRLVHRFRDTGSVGERPRSGAPRGTTRNDDQYLRTYALRNRDLTGTPDLSQLWLQHGSRVSRQTKVMKSVPNGLRARRLLHLFIECFTTTFLRAHSWLNRVGDYYK